jgi:hypothetical protein
VALKTKKSEPSKCVKVVIYGVQGVGKSTFMAHAPKPIFLDFEDSTNDLDVRVELLDPAPKTWQETLDALGQLATEDHGFLTCCIDSADWLEQLAIDHIVRKYKASGFQDPKCFGYGKGDQILFEEWRNLIIALQRLHKRGMNVLLSAHSRVRTYNDPMGASFDRYSLKLKQTNQVDLAGYTQEWAQCVVFAHYDTVVGKIDERNVGLRGTTRVLHCNRTDAYDAKNRCGLPDKMPLDWDTFFAAVRDGTPESPDAIVARIKELGPIPEAAQQSMDRNIRDPRKLSQLENWLKAKQQPQQSQEKENENAS